MPKLGCSQFKWSKISISDIFFKCLSALTQWRLCPIQRLQCVEPHDFFAAEALARICQKKHAFLKALLKHCRIVQLLARPTLILTQATHVTFGNILFYNYFFSFIKNSILMYLLTQKKLSKIDLLIIDELSYILSTSINRNWFSFLRMK